MASSRSVARTPWKRIVSPPGVAGACALAVEDDKRWRAWPSPSLVLAAWSCSKRQFRPSRREQAREEFEVALAVLGADGARCSCLRDVEVEAHLRIVGQQFGDDIARVHVLEDVAVAAQRQQRQRRLEPQPVARHAAVGAQPRRLRCRCRAMRAGCRRAAAGATVSSSPMNSDRSRSVDVLSASTSKQNSSLTASRPLKLFGHQRFGQAAVLRTGQRDQPRVLAQPRAEIERWNPGQRIHPPALCLSVKWANITFQTGICVAMTCPLALAQARAQAPPA